MTKPMSTMIGKVTMNRMMSRLRVLMLMQTDSNQR
jgi:hypothetical protein